MSSAPQVSGDTPTEPDEPIEPLLERLEEATRRLEETRLAKGRAQQPVLELIRRLLLRRDGLEPLYHLAPRLDAAGVFTGTDWEDPAALVPTLVRGTLEHGQKTTVVLDCLSNLRMLAIAGGHTSHPTVSPEFARAFLTQVLALNLDRLSGTTDETLRTRLGELAPAVGRLFSFLVEHIGFEDILGNLMEEIWRILAQRPVQVVQVKAMVTQIAVAMADGADLGDARLGADRLISALFGPTQGSRHDPGLDAYRAELDTMDQQALQAEAYGFARAMHDVGLVSDYHAVFVRWLLEKDRHALLADALGLSSTGLDALRSYQDLVHRLVEEAIFPQTAQAVYGLALLLERGILYTPPIAPGLWRKIRLEPSPTNAATLAAAFGDSLPPRVFLLAGVIQLLGQPLGVGQGHNPTCQAARAISMWALNAPDYLLHLTTQAACYDGVLMHFEGHPIQSQFLPAGLARIAPLDTDPVSVVLVPHLDRVYQEMGRLCAGRGEDPHRWINPEFHGWWVGREFLIAVDVATGALRQHEAFLRQLWASYHPIYNGNQPLIHPQPAGVAVTDSRGEFVGWHAITLLRVGLDRDGVMRVYFFNPNNDSGQDWGQGVVVSTHGAGERFGEGSLPFTQMASRLYIFHDDPVDPASTAELPAGEIAEARAMATATWAKNRGPG